MTGQRSHSYSLADPFYDMTLEIRPLLMFEET